MEAKNGFFKQKKLNNTKNVPKSMAAAHQQWMCCLQHDNSGKACSVFLKFPAFPAAHVPFVDNDDLTAKTTVATPQELNVYVYTYIVVICSTISNTGRNNEDAPKCFRL